MSDIYMQTYIYIHIYIQTNTFNIPEESITPLVAESKIFGTLS